MTRLLVGQIVSTAATVGCMARLQTKSCGGVKPITKKCMHGFKQLGMATKKKSIRSSSCQKFYGCFGSAQTVELRHKDGIGKVAFESTKHQ